MTLHLTIVITFLNDKLLNFKISISVPKQDLTIFLSFSLTSKHSSIDDITLSKAKIKRRFPREHVRPRIKRVSGWSRGKSTNLWRGEVDRGRNPMEYIEKRNGRVPPRGDSADRTRRERRRSSKDGRGVDRSVLDTFRTMAPNWSSSTGRQLFGWSFGAKRGCQETDTK